MAFDPNKPFVVVGRTAPAPAFDPTKPFAVVKGAAPAAPKPAAAGGPPVPAPLPDLGGKGLVQGAVLDPIEGLAQLAGLIPGVKRLANDVPGFSAVASAADRYRKEASGPGEGWARVVGNVVSPLNWVPAARVADAVPLLSKAPLAKDVVMGALAGAAQPSAHSTVRGKIAQAAAGGLTGGALHGIGKAVGHALRPAAQELVDQGVRLTPGAQFGRAGRELADVVSKAPLVGDVVAAGNRRMIDDFNRAMYDQALAPLGERITGPERGNAGMAAMRDKIDAAYTKAIRGLSFRASEPFMEQMNGIRRELPPRSRAVFDEVVRDRMPWLYSNGPAMKKLTGDELSAEVSYLRKAGRSLRGITGTPDQQDAGHALRLLVRSLGDHAIETEPGARALKANADNAYARYLILKRAAGGATAGGRFTPTDVLKASKALAEFDRTFVEGRANMQPAAQRALSVIGNPPLEAGRSIWGAGMDIGGALAALHDPAAAAYAAGVLGPALAAHTEPGMNALRRLTVSPVRGAVGRSLLDAIPFAGAAAGRAAR